MYEPRAEGNPAVRLDRSSRRRSHYLSVIPLAKMTEGETGFRGVYFSLRVDIFLSITITVRFFRSTVIWIDRDQKIAVSVKKKKNDVSTTCTPTHKRVI